MDEVFQKENPVLRFFGNFADMFLLSVCWYVCCIPVVTIGAGTTAMYYVTMRLVADREESTLRSFWHSFRTNFRQATTLWIGALLLGGVLGADLYWGHFSGSDWGLYVLPTFALLGLLYLMAVSFLFPLLARADCPNVQLVKLCVSIILRNILPILGCLIVWVGTFAAGVFLFWPLLLIAPGFAAYLNSYLYNHILKKYHLGMKQD